VSSELVFDLSRINVQQRMCREFQSRVDRREYAAIKVVVVVY
jgi:hypothetical protein